MSYNFDELSFSSVNRDRAAKHASFSFPLTSAAAGVIGAVLCFVKLILGLPVLAVSVALAVFNGKRAVCRTFLEKYYPVIRNGAKSSYEISLVTGVSKQKVESDLEKLISWGILVPEKGVTSTGPRLVPVSARRYSGDVREESEAMKKFSRAYADADRVLTEGLAKISDPAMRLRVDNVREAMTAIAESCRRDEKCLSYTGRMFSYYVPTLSSVMRTLSEMEASGSGSEVVRDKIRGAAASIAVAFGEILRKCISKRDDDVTDEITVLGQILAIDALTGEDLNAAKADAESNADLSPQEPGAAALELNEIDRLIQKRLLDIESGASSPAPAAITLTLEGSSGTTLPGAGNS